MIFQNESVLHHLTEKFLQYNLIYLVLKMLAVHEIASTSSHDFREHSHFVELLKPSYKRKVYIIHHMNVTQKSKVNERFK
jgi:hypothetical protein